MHPIEKEIGYSFKKQEYLTVALTHSSYANENKSGGTNNERQEFLGDAVLSIIVSDYLFRNKNAPEGELTKIRASLVCEPALAQFAVKFKLGEHLLLGKGEEHNGGRTRPSILADAFEAVLAAIYLDGGIEAARSFLLPLISDAALNATSKDLHDYKTQLQEIIQKNPEEKINYVLVGEDGPDHNKWFSVQVHLNSNVIGQGSGKSKKIAEQQAAKEALNLMGVAED